MAEIPLVGEEFAGYRLVSVLGRGGMSIVFRAENPRLGNVIALKVLAPELASNDVFRSRFLEESRIAASMNHPNVIPIHDTGSSDGLLYIAMRCVTGTDLRQMLKQRGPLPADEAVFLVSQAARALDAAHRRGLVHRDVKPANLLIERGTDDGDPEHVYLTDFGITKHQDGVSGLTSAGALLGTIDYIAPEQIRGMSVLGMADQYSLGCVLYECLTGRLPYEKDFGTAIMWAHVEEPPVPPTAARPGLPPAIDDVFAKVLAKRPGDRYDSCRAFMNDAREALGLAEAHSGSGSLGMMPGSAAAGYSGALASTPPPGTDGTAGPDYQRAEKYEPAGESTRSWPVSTGASAPPPTTADRVLPPPGPGGPGAGRRRRRAPTWLLAALALLLVAGAAAGVTLGLTGGRNSPQAGGGTPTAGGSATASASAMASATASAGMSMSATAPANETPRTANCAPTGSVALAAKNQGATGPTTLTGVLQLADLCSTPQGILPQSSCQATNPTAVTCTNPVAGIAKVYFTTYASTTALYTEYVNQVTALNGSYTPNTMTHCGNVIGGYAETGWNHLEAHPTQYTYQQMEATGFNQVNAMGRQACGVFNGKPYLVWTTDIGNMLAVAEGSGSMTQLYNWWANLHHVVIFRGTVMCGQDMGRMSSVPQGNLKSSMVCPAGVTPASAGMTSAPATSGSMPASPTMTASMSS